MYICAHARTQTDSKKELEKALRSVCEAFTKVTAVRAAGAAGGNTQPLREQAFAALPRLQDVVNKVREQPPV